MRTTTTVRLPDALLAQAKKKARERGTTVTSLIEEGLRTVISTASKTPKRVRPPISTVHGGPLVDITRSADLQDLFDEEAFRDGGVDKLR